MPQMGFDMQEGTVARWVKKEGEQVARGEPVVEVETDKATVEVEAFASGVLRKIVVSEGTTVPVGQVIGFIAEPDEEIPEITVAVKPPTAEPPKEVVERGAETTARVAEERVVASPVARRMAEEKGMDLRQIKGTGPGGRITKDDVLAYEAKEKAAPTPEKKTAPAMPGEVRQLSRMRQTVARRMTQGKQEIPHFYVTTSADMTEAMHLRAQLNELWEEESHITVNDMIVKASALALPQFPEINAVYADGAVKYNEAINIGIAIAMKEGLIAPAILDCASKTLKEIGVASRDLINRAKEGVLKPEEYTAATFSITNLGMFDVDNFIAIINPGQTATLAVGAVRTQPIVEGDDIAIAQVMQLTLSVDHRVTDGAQAAQFLGEVKALLQNPLRLAL